MFQGLGQGVQGPCGHQGDMMEGGKRQAMSGSMVLQHPGSMLVSMASVTIEGADNWGLSDQMADVGI